jgi:hypothetical protein
MDIRIHTHKKNLSGISQLRLAWQTSPARAHTTFPLSFLFQLLRNPNLAQTQIRQLHPRQNSGNLFGTPAYTMDLAAVPSGYQFYKRQSAKRQYANSANR